jgi:phenylalanine-4-hydroxylase
MSSVAQGLKPGLRGDYADMAPDYTVAQKYSSYSAADHEVWRQLYRRQSGLVERYACKEYVEGVARMGVADAIPDFGAATAQLSAATGWSIVAVPGLLPDATFFDHLAARRFPVTVWIRRPEELDYLQEPDLFHDFFGHVPLLLNPIFADYMEAYGRGGQKALREGGLEMLARLYWYTVEFGLIRGAHGLKAYGAGMLSSSAELPYSVESAAPNRVGFRLERIMRTRYIIDAFQKTYFVLDNFEQLFAATRPDFRPIYDRLRSQPTIGAGSVLDEDILVNAA